MKSFFNHFLWKTTSALTLLFSVPQVALGIEECEGLDIDLEVAIGAADNVEGLTNYVTIVYQFVVSAVAIVAVIAIMYWGFRWVTAAGNQTIIGNAKEGIVSALIGLVIALTSYTILFLINSSLVAFPRICATGIAFQSFGTNWETCQTRASQNARDCTAFDYCEADEDRGCSCGPVEGSQAFYCLPLATYDLTEDMRCRRDSNCVDPLKCAGGSDAVAGECRQMNVNADCTDDPDICIAPLECLESHNDKRKCATLEGRSVGQFCEEDRECETLACDESANVCVEGSEDAYCTSDSACTFGYTCEVHACTNDAGAPQDCCKAKSVGSDCDEENGCPGTMFCVDTNGFGSTCQSGAEGAHCDGDYQCLDTAPFCVANDGSPGENTCFAGEPGDACDNNADCQEQSCYNNECYAYGEEFGGCTNDSDCVSVPYCVEGVCRAGGINDPCVDSGDCADGRQCSTAGNVCLR